MKIKITSDSTCDLSPELVEKYDVGIFPLYVYLGDDDLLDGVNVVPQDIYDFYTKNKQLPKTGARNEEDYYEYFKEVLESGYDAVVHFNISSEMSVTHHNAVQASKRLKNVYVVDSRNLSTGTGLLVLDACDMVQKGMSAKNIAARAAARADSVQASFIINSLEFLHKGGRCSSMAYFGANLLQIKPSIIVKNGKMDTWNKHMGKYNKCVQKYVDIVHNTFTNPDKKRCFITHTLLEDGMAEAVAEQVKSWGVFDEILDTTAGATVTTHCGAGTIGVLFINDGGLE